MESRKAMGVVYCTGEGLEVAYVLGFGLPFTWPASIVPLIWTGRGYNATMPAGSAETFVSFTLATNRMVRGPGLRPKWTSRCPLLPRVIR